ncbi:hypothetical protein NPIL_524271 [Nephila pilipes]|uniref:Uncharacterized protein n=1 Tax=Nephila pilipes TaxID=299642 RepID=A0A8X6PLK2_NEPPI|nr:hypothetical protein NPIL_524271 [Nephila pilipes]
MQIRQPIMNTDALDPDPVLRCMPTKPDSGRPHKPCSAMRRNWISQGSCKVLTTKSKAETFSAQAAELETLAPESAAGTSSAREASRRLGLPPSSWSS